MFQRAASAIAMPRRNQIAVRRKLWVKAGPACRFLRPSTGVRISLNSRHQINHPAQRRLVPRGDSCAAARVSTPPASLFIPHRLKKGLHRSS